MLRTEDTICAPATSGGGAIAVIRVSGSESISICDRIFMPAETRIKLSEQKGYTIVYGEIHSGEDIIDDVLISIFRAPHSYTGEDSIEISCHASRYIQQKILELLIQNGAVPANPGEFTMRAFLNGKMDLSQAEAVADLIASESEAAHKIAVRQMRGEFSDEIRILRADLLHFASLIELELDFGEEDVEFADRDELLGIVDKVINVARELTSSFRLGNVIKTGVPIAIVGNPNTGKSTLLNKLLNEDKAIVTEIPGTTRDTIEDVVVIDGIQYRFIDTAGIRDSGDVIENIGINKTYEKITAASLIMLVADVNEGTGALTGVLNNIRNQISGNGKKLLILINKTDTDLSGKCDYFKNEIKLQESEYMLFISAKTGDGLDNLRETISQSIESERMLAGNVIVSNIRHYEALSQVTESLERVRSGLKGHLQEDLIAIDIRHAIHYLGEITGEITTDEILGNIFRNFCIGK